MGESQDKRTQMLLLQHPNARPAAQMYAAAARIFQRIRLRRGGASIIKHSPAGGRALKFRRKAALLTGFARFMNGDGARRDGAEVKNLSVNLKTNHAGGAIKQRVDHPPAAGKPLAADVAVVPINRLAGVFRIGRLVTAGCSVKRREILSDADDKRKQQKRAY